MPRRNLIAPEPTEFTISAHAITRPEAPPVSHVPRSGADVLALQRSAGNRATASLLARTDPSRAVVQRVKLKGNKEEQYWKKFKDWTSESRELFNEVVEWCHSTIQLDEVLAKLDSSQWTDLAREMTGAAAYEFPTIREAHAQATAGARQSTGKKTDPYANVKSKIRSAGLKPADFAEGDLASLEIAGPRDGWSAAIQSIWQQITERAQSAQLHAERTARYSAAKVAGDQIFAGGLVQLVWQAAHATATAGSGGGNLTVAGTHTDATILPAVALWRARRNTLLGASPGTVTNFHVPGGTSPIEDKSRRADNPDPSRGRQADFISDWGNTAINVHVDADPQH